MEALPTEKEVKSAVFGINKDNAAGRDGFSSLFYQAWWEIIKGDLTEAVMDFFHGFSQPKGFSSSMIVLIPKRLGAVHWKDLRPISLCNVCSKLLSKILSTRLNKVLPEIVSPFQAGFVPGRHIEDNILVA